MILMQLNFIFFFSYRVALVKQPAALMPPVTALAPSPLAPSHQAVKSHLVPSACPFQHLPVVISTPPPPPPPTLKCLLPRPSPVVAVTCPPSCLAHAPPSCKTNPTHSSNFDQSKRPATAWRSTGFDSKTPA